MAEGTAPSRRLKIGYVMQADAADMSQISGPQIHVQAVIQGLRRRGHQVRLVAIQGGQTLWTDDLEHWQPCAFGFSRSRAFRLVESPLRAVQSRLHLPFLRLFDSYRFSDACVSALRGYDVLYERYGLLSTGGLMAAKRLRVPLVLEVNGDYEEEYRNLGIRLSGPQWGVARRITEGLFSGAAHLVASGEGLRHRLVERWRVPPGKVTVVANGTDYALFAEPRDPVGVRAAYALPSGPIVVHVGGFQPWQGVDVLVAAFAQVRGRHPDASLVLIGDGPERPQAERQSAGLGMAGATLFLGTRRPGEVAGVLSASEVAVAPYKQRAETAGMKILDYMAAGKAIVASAWGGRHSVLTHMETALLVEPGHQGELADAILLLLRDEQLRARLGANAQALARRAYTWDHTAARIEDVCRAAMEPPT